MVLERLVEEEFQLPVVDFQKHRSNAQESKSCVPKLVCRSSGLSGTIRRSPRLGRDITRIFLMHAMISLTIVAYHL